METKHVIVFLAIMIAAVVFWFTLPDAIEIQPKNETPMEPWMQPEVQHMAEHGIRINPAPDADIRVTREADSLKVEISPAFLKKQEAGFLPMIGMLKPTETMSNERFAEFIGALHMIVLAEDEKAGHIHEHQEGEADPHSEQEGHGGDPIDIISK